jgi:8-oxo-dGTP pyrophosphatase MutT (NUDIX family)
MNPRLRPEAAPAWLARLVRGCASVGVEDVPMRRRPSGDGREAAVLVLVGESDDAGPDLLLTERAADMRDHAGQAAFPGGGLEVGDQGPVGAALREAAEETGLDPAGVVPLATLPGLTIPVTGFAVTPVVAYWAEPSPVRAVDPAETAAVVRVPVRELADPARRFRVTGPTGHVGPAFAVGGLLVWGFTAGLVDWVLDLAGWSYPWDTTDVRDLADVWARRHELSQAPPTVPTSEGGPIR